MQFITKPRLLLIIAAALVVPLLGGGKDNLAFILNFFAVGLAIFLLYRSEDKPGIGGAVPALLLALVGWGCLSLLWSVSNFHTLSWIIQWLGVLGAVAIGSWLAADQKRQESWLKAYIWVAAMFGAYGMFLLVTAEYNRLTSTFYWPNPMAGFLLPAVFLAVFRWGDKGGKVNGVAAVIIGASLLLTNSRGGLLSLAVVGVLAAVMVRRPVRFWLRLLLVVLLAFGLSTVIAQTRNTLRKSAPSIATHSSRFAEAVSGESLSVTDRINYLKSSVNMIGDSPVHGTGAGTFAATYPKYQVRVLSAGTNPHNLYAQTAAELGLVGGLLLVAVTIVTLRRGWQGRSNDNTLPILLGFAALAIHMGLDIDGAYPTILLLAGILVGLLAGSGSRRYPYLSIVGLLAVVLLIPAVSLYQSQAARERGDIEQGNHNYAAAAGHFAQASAGLIYNPDVHTAEGINYYTLAAMGIDASANADLAHAAAIEAIARDSGDSQHYLLKARTEVLLGRLDDAEHSYRQAISADSLNHPQHYTGLARLLVHRQQWAEALVVINKVLELYPDEVVGLRHLDSVVTEEIESARTLRSEIITHLPSPN